MPEPKPTPPQTRVLAAAAEGVLCADGTRPVRIDGHTVRAQVVKACLDHGWLKIERRGPGTVRPRYRLTEYGEKILETRL